MVADGGWQSSGTDPVACNVNQITDPVFHTKEKKIFLSTQSLTSYEPNCPEKEPKS